MKASARKAADQVARKTQKSVSAPEIGGQAAIGHTSLRYPNYPESIGNKPSVRIFNREDKLAHVLVIGQSEFFRMREPHQERHCPNHGRIDEYQGPTRPGAFLPGLGNAQYRVKNRVDFDAGVQTEPDVKPVPDVIPDRMGRIFADNVG